MYFYLDVIKDYVNVCRSNRRDLINIIYYDVVLDLIFDIFVVL